MNLLGQMNVFSPYLMNNRYEYKKIIIKFGYPFNDIIPYLSNNEIEIRRRKLDRYINMIYSFTLLSDKIKMEI